MTLASRLPLLTRPQPVIETFGRAPVTIVELVQDWCTNQFGVNDGVTSFCTAVGAAGSECYHTWQTCTARAAYRRGQRMVRFCEPAADVPPAWRAIPSVIEVQRQPGRINIGARSGTSGALG